MKTIVVATRNPHKVEEYRAMFAPFGFAVSSLLDHTEIPETEETGATFAANALLKAEAVVNALGVPAVADDSGLEVAALGGAPGVRSQRFSPQGTAAANNTLLLARLDGIALRAARFVCTICVLLPTGERRFYEGKLDGTIGTAPRGANGFGYDPLFLVSGSDRTVAELPAAEKNRISHRGQAFSALMRDVAWWNR